jgi:hypothetical protein
MDYVCRVLYALIKPFMDYIYRDSVILRELREKSICELGLEILSKQESTL